ncbi:hypothetical protein KC318_g4497 [Hortaea werneckii]|nr:hypothetical protein KC334_g2085 [Hortaea werneckii]KAI7022205.1 hypothetical protein KC355_g2138 [Hortaea werneckii]KAI7198862.1 hypothetical protein KC324_g3549 [Hortaea werneckii]KAI7591826.1 hypothetical protein KC316_g2650 [Hortaea werneckii]KAI7669680.1 hypothetical protein KC318_g4497 [Hortaea werneckii]
MGVSTRHKTPSPRQFLLGGSNIQKRSRQDTHQPSNFTRPAKHSRKDVDDPSLARNEEVEVEDAPSDMDEDDDYHGSGAVTLKTLVGPLTVDARVAIAVQHLLFDGPEHPLYAGHLDAIISRCDGQSIGESGYQLQRMCEFIHAQASELNMVPKGSQLEEEVRTVWAKEQGQALAEQIKGTSAFPDVIAAMVMEEAQHHSSSDRVKDILRAVEDRCDKQAQAPVVEESVPQDSAGLDEHLALPHRPETDAPTAYIAKPDATYRPLSATFCQPFGVAPYQASSTGAATEQAPKTAAVVAKPDATYRPLSAAFCQPFGAALHQASSAGSASEQAPKTGPTAGSTGLDRGGFSAASVAEKVLPSGPMSEATRSFPRSVSAFSTGEPPKGRGLASYREEPGQKQSTVQNSNGTGGSINGRFGYGHPLHNWIVRPAVKIEEIEQDGNAPAHSTSAQNVAAVVSTAPQSLQQDGGGPATSGSAEGVPHYTGSRCHPLQQALPAQCVVLDGFIAKNTNNRVTDAVRTTFQPFGWRETKRLPGGYWLVRLGNLQYAQQAASHTLKLESHGWESLVKPRLYMDPQMLTAIVPIRTSLPGLLDSISTLYKRPFCLQYLQNTPISLVMVLTLSERILANVFKLNVAVDGISTTIQFTDKQPPAGHLKLVPTTVIAQPFHLSTPPTASQD